MLRALLLLSVVLAAEASAKCASYALTVFPPTKDALPLNPVFVVRGFARAQELLKDPATWRLVGPEGKSVPLKLQRTLNGYREQQLVFRTEEPLRPGAPYPAREVSFTSAV